jgi:hypothetical protein
MKYYKIEYETIIPQNYKERLSKKTNFLCSELQSMANVWNDELAADFAAAEKRKSVGGKK